MREPIMLSEEEQRIAMDGCRATAIKSLAARTGCGLRHAHDLVDAFVTPILVERERGDLENYQKAAATIQRFVSETERLQQELRRVSRLVIYDRGGQIVTQGAYNALECAYYAMHEVGEAGKNSSNVEQQEDGI